MNDTTTWVVKSQQMEVVRPIVIAYGKKQELLDVETVSARVGRSSLTLAIRVYCKGTLHYRCEVSMVLVDQKLLKSTPLHEKFRVLVRERMAGRGGSPTNFCPRVEICSEPKDEQAKHVPFIKSVKVRYSETDLNEHTNHAQYVKWFEDMLMEGIAEKKTAFFKEFVLKGLRVLHIAYDNETKMGENLTLTAFPVISCGRFKGFGFSCKKENGKIACRAIMTSKDILASSKM